MYVHPDWRREGVGESLLAETVADLRDRGAERVDATVLAAMAALCDRAENEQAEGA